MSSTDDEVYLKAVCSDVKCQAAIYLTSRIPTVECFHCGQQHQRKNLQNVQQLDEIDGLEGVLEHNLILSCLPKRGPDMVKVLGLSNYFCKLLSPLLTRYGMDRATGKPKLLKEMGLGDTFDCSSLSSRAFLIDPRHISINGFGRDVTGSGEYLAETLQLIKHSNGGEERLLPIYADGDGHCLVHAISRALVGRELFWHPLRSSLKRLFERNLEKFKELFENFIGADEWQTIIDECDPDFKPPEGDFHGLRNIHIFGLANVLRRPIILLDSWECMNKSGDYSGLFLPGFIPPSECRGENNALNKPICIAWSNKSHNHYIPLVGILNMPLPVLPRTLIPSVFRMPQSEIASYIEFDDNDNCVIGGNRVLSDNYIQCLVFAMETQFAKVHGIRPTLVADAKHFIYSNNVFLNTSTAAVIHQVKNLTDKGFLFRCSTCTALCEMHVEPSLFCRGGYFYNTLLENNSKLVHNNTYVFPIRHNDYVSCKYDSRNDVLIPDINSFKMEKCTFCHSRTVQRIVPYVSQEIKNMVSRDTPSSSNQKDGHSTEEPELPRLKVKWEDATVEDVIPDFQLVKEDDLIEAVDGFAKSFIQRHFTGEVANNILQSYIAGEILKKVGKTPASTSLTDSSQTSKDESEMETEKVSLPTPNVPETTDKIQSEPSTSQRQYVKLVSISGDQVTLDLNEKGVFYGQLQEIVKQKFNIPIPNQRVKIGVPPKILKLPNDIERQALTLKHGDRLLVENHPVHETKRFASTPYNRSNVSSNRSAECSGEIWKAAKLQPHLFKKGGIYFDEVNNKHILTDLKHVNIESFPNKWFSYNGNNHSLELCVKPYGHFEIAPDIDSRIEQVMNGESVRGYRACPIIRLAASQKDLKPIKAPEHASTITPPTSSGTGLLRKGPGFSVLTRPKPSDMDLS